MNNLLGDIPQWALDGSDDEDDNLPKDGASGDVEMQKTAQAPDYMEDFFRHVDSIKADIDAVTKASKDIAKINEQSMQATTTAEENKLSKKLKPLVDKTNKRARACKNLLGLLKEDTESLKEAKKLNASDVRYVLVVVQCFLVNPLCCPVISTPSDTHVANILTEYVRIW